MVEALRGQLDGWLRQRLPTARATTLNQRKIFIVPSKTAVGLLAIIALLFLLGINFQNSLVYIICFWLLAMLLLNIVYTWRNLAGLTLTAIGVEPCFAGEKAVLEVELTRPARHPKYALELAWAGEDQVQVNLASAQTLRVKLSHRTRGTRAFQAAAPPRIHPLPDRVGSGVVVCLSGCARAWYTLPPSKKPSNPAAMPMAKTAQLGWKLPLEPVISAVSAITSTVMAPSVSIGLNMPKPASCIPKPSSITPAMTCGWIGMPCRCRGSRCGCRICAAKCWNVIRNNANTA